MNKPNGQLVVSFKEAAVVQFAQDLPIRKVKYVNLIYLYAVRPYTQTSKSIVVLC